MMVWRDRETGPVHPSIRSAPSTGTFGMSLSVTTFMMTLRRVEASRVSKIPRRHKAGIACRVVDRRKKGMSHGVRAFGKGPGTAGAGRGLHGRGDLSERGGAVRAGRRGQPLAAGAIAPRAQGEGARPRSVEPVSAGEP